MTPRFVKEKGANGNLSLRQVYYERRGALQALLVFVGK